MTPNLPLYNTVSHTSGQINVFILLYTVYSIVYSKPIVLTQPAAAVGAKHFYWFSLRVNCCLLQDFRWFQTWNVHQLWFTVQLEMSDPLSYQPTIIMLISTKGILTHECIILIKACCQMVSDLLLPLLLSGWAAKVHSTGAHLTLECPTYPIPALLYKWGQKWLQLKSMLFCKSWVVILQNL